MDAKYYRFMFQNMNDSVYYTGSLWNTYENERFHFLYISAVTEHVVSRMEQDRRFARDTYPLDVLILSDLNRRYIELVIKMLYQRNIKCVVMPYFTPKDRGELLSAFGGQETVSQEVKEFMDDPYHFLLESGVEKVFLIQGNGAVYDGSTKTEGYHFEEVSSRTMQIITAMEAKSVPVYKAGYIISGDWILYLGNYGEGTDSTLVLYNGSVSEDPEEEDCTLYIRTFSQMQNCCSYMESKDFACDILCNYKNDFDCLKKHNRNGMKEYINGTLLLGNMQIKGQVEKLYQRFAAVKEKVRFISLPNGGAGRNWDKRILGFGKEHYRSYWVCPSSHLTSAEAIRDISISSPYNHFMMTDEYFGVCMSGFLKNRADIVLPDINNDTN